MYFPLLKGKGKLVVSSRLSNKNFATPAATFSMACSRRKVQSPLFILLKRGLALETKGTPENLTWEMKLLLSGNTANNHAAGA